MPPTSSNSLNRRIDIMEQKLKPKNDYLFVMINDKDKSIEEAKQRVMQEQGIDKLSDDCFIFIMNLTGRKIK